MNAAKFCNVLSSALAGMPCLLLYSPQWILNFTGILIKYRTLGEITHCINSYYVSFSIVPFRKLRTCLLINKSYKKKVVNTAECSNRRKMGSIEWTFVFGTYNILYSSLLNWMEKTQSAEHLNGLSWKPEYKMRKLKCFQSLMLMNEQEHLQYLDALWKLKFRKWNAYSSLFLSLVLFFLSCFYHVDMLKK